VWLAAIPESPRDVIGEGQTVPDDLVALAPVMCGVTVQCGEDPKHGDHLGVVIAQFSHVASRSA
jgi:hypothetical protein